MKLELCMHAFAWRVCLWANNFLAQKQDHKGSCLSLPRLKSWALLLGHRCSTLTCSFFFLTFLLRVVDLAKTILGVPGTRKYNVLFRLKWGGEEA